jgi:cell division septum initiation protein DivIVA
MSDDVLSNFPEAIPVRFRGYDRNVVDEELHELRSALDRLQDERDRAMARANALETQLDPARAGGLPVTEPATSPTSATVHWLIDTAERDAEQIKKNAQEQVARATQQAEQLLRQRIELIDQAQHEADVCRAKAAEEARAIVEDALEQAQSLIGGLRESEAAIRELFAGGRLTHRMPPPREPADQNQGQHAAAMRLTVPDPTPFETSDPGSAKV